MDNTLSKNIKCAIISPGFLPVPAIHGGAVEVLTQSLIEGNEKEKVFDIDLFTIYDKKLSDYKYENCNTICVKVSMYDKLVSKAYNFIHRLLKKSEDIICPYGVAVNRLMKKRNYDYIVIENNMKVFNSIHKPSKYIFHLHCDIWDSEKPRLLCERVLDRSSYILTVSKYIANRMLTVKQSDKVKVLYNCVDFSNFDKKMLGKELVLKQEQQFNIEKDDFVFAYVGRITEPKGVYELVAAFLKLKKEIKKIKLLVIGNGWFTAENMTDFEKKLKKMTEEVKEDIIFTGFVAHDDVPKVLSMADCVVIPSKCQEAFPVVPLEAMAMEKTIIATKVGGMVESLDEDCAILIEKENLTENLYESMKKIYSNEELKKRLSKNAYDKIHSNKAFDEKLYFDNFCRTIGIDL